jgi:hypothetical protein
MSDRIAGPAIPLAALLAVAICLVLSAPAPARIIDPGIGSATATRSDCVRPHGVQALRFSRTKYPHIRRHFLQAVAAGWPRVQVVNRPSADGRRDRLLRDYPTRDGMDRDEYPAAALRGRGRGLERGRKPRGWKAHVRHVPSSENRSHGATLGNMMRGFCDGTKVRYVFY